MSASYRPGTEDDVRATYDVFIAAVTDLDRRRGVGDADNVWLDPAFVAPFWAQQRPLFAHLARTAEHFWVAEQAGRVVGYARATRHDGVRELTDFFVRPDAQGHGIGRELLARAFPAAGARRRALVASADIVALTSYLKAGVTPRCPIAYVSGTPRPVAVPTDLAVEPLAPGPDALGLLRAIDRAVLGFARDADHAFLLGARTGVLYRRGGQPVGYGYEGGRRIGPLALLDPADVPAALALAETAVAARGEPTVSMYLPLVNRAAVDHALARRFRLEPDLAHWMTDEPFADLTRYVLTSPPFFV
jgi:GNAT superfamily N-acetyltransferase